MSLLMDAMEDCRILNKRIEADGVGGYIATWSDGPTFKAALSFNTSLEARVAEKQGVTNLYTVTTPRAMVLQYHDVFRRLSDEKIFRVTSDGDDKATPRSAALDMRVVSAEEWSIDGDLSE